MSSSTAFLHKEFLEIVKTWRIWVLPGMLLFFGISSPLIALLTPTLVSSIAGSQPGVVIQVPDPVPLDAYKQFLKNLDQIVLITIVIAGAGVVSGECRAGTAALILTKPLSRTGFILAKITAQQILVVGAVAVGTGVCAGMTTLLFGASPAGGFILSILVWLVLALLMVVVMTLLSALFSSRGGAAGVGLLIYLLLMLLRAWPLFSKYTFAGLPVASSGLLAGESVPVFWPMVTALVAAGVLAVCACRIFHRKEL